MGLNLVLLAMRVERDACPRTNHLPHHSHHRDYPHCDNLCWLHRPRRRRVNSNIHPMDAWVDGCVRGCVGGGEWTVGDGR